MTKENQKIKEKNKEYAQKENKYNNIEQENEKLNNKLNEIDEKNNSLEKELNAMKEKYEKLMKEKNRILEEEQQEKKRSSRKPTKVEENKEVNNINNKNRDRKGLTSNDSSKPNNQIDNGNKEIYYNRFPDRSSYLSPEDILRRKRIRENRLRNLFRNKVIEMKDYMHRKFMKFYCNGIFLQMTGKITVKPSKADSKVAKTENFNNILSKFENSSDNKDNNDPNNKMSPLKRRVSIFEGQNQNSQKKAPYRRRASAPEINFNLINNNNNFDIKKRASIFETPIKK